MERKKRKRRRKNKQKMGEHENIISCFPIFSLDLCPHEIKVGETFLGSKVLRKDELWRWDGNLEDVKF